MLDNNFNRKGTQLKHAIYLLGFLRASSSHKEYDMSYNIYKYLMKWRIGSKCLPVDIASQRVHANVTLLGHLVLGDSQRRRGRC